MYWTNSTVVTTPMDTVDTAQESNQNQYAQLSATEIKKVLSFSSMNDTGKFAAIIANTDTAGLLAMVGISYADMKGILALPNDKLTTAAGISPAYPSTENAGVTSVHDASPSLAPPALAVMHDAGLPPKTIDAGADIDAINTPSPATSGMIPHSNPAPLAPAPETNGAQGMLPDDSCTAELQPVVAEPVPVPENSDVQGMLPDGPCYVDLGEITQAPADPVDLPPESGSNGLFSVAAMRNVLDFFGMSDAGTAETLEAFTNIYDFFEWFDKLLIMKNAALIPADAGVNAGGGEQQNDNPIAAPDGNVDIDAGAGNAHHDDDTEQHTDAGIGADTDAQHNGTDDSIVANDDSGAANDAVHTPTGAEADAQNNGGDLHDDTKQNQNDGDSPLVSSESLLGTPPGPGSTPPVEQPEPPPLALPPVVQTTQPEAPVTETVIPQPVPETPVTQQPTAVPNQLPASNQGDNTQNIPSNTETAGGIKSVDKPPAVKGETGGGGGSSSGWGGFGVSSSGGGGGGFSGGGRLGLSSTIGAGGAVSLIVHEVENGQTGFNLGGGGNTGHNSDTRTPPVQTPTQAPDWWQRAYDAYQALNKAFDGLNTKARDLWNERYALEIRVERAQARITTIDSAMESELENIDMQPEIVHLTTQNDALRELRAENLAATAAAQQQATTAQALATRAQAALRNALATISEIDNQKVEYGDEQARIDHQTDIVVDQGNILHQQNAIYKTQQDTLNKLRNSLRGQEYIIRENTNEINRLRAEAYHETIVNWRDGTNYIKDLEKYIDENNSRLAQIQTAIDANDALRVKAYATLDEARKLVLELSPFRNGRHQDLEDHYGPVDLNDHEPTREAWDMEDDLIGKLPPAPPHYHISEGTPGPSGDNEGNASGTGATHTTTGTTGAPGDGQDDEENDADGDSHMGIHLNVNLAPDPATEPTTTPGNAQSHPPADALNTLPNPADQPAVTDATHATTTAGTTSLPTGTGSHPPAGPVSLNVAPGTSANHDLSVQVEMVHPSVLAGSSTAVLHADTVMHDLPIIHAIIDAWIRTLPASAQISLQGFDILNADQTGQVTLAIQFAPLSGHTVDANLPADAVAVLKAAIQAAVASWEEEQENAAAIVNDTTPNLSAGAPEHPLVNTSQSGDHSNHPDSPGSAMPAPLLSTLPVPVAALETPLHYGTADMLTPGAVTLGFEFSSHSGISEPADFIHRGHDIPALQGVLAHWMGSIDPGFAATVVAFDIIDMSNDGDILLQVLVSDMPVIPEAATLSALQNAMLDYLATPESPVPDHPANLDGTTHQALRVVGVAEHDALD